MRSSRQIAREEHGCTPEHAAAQVSTTPDVIATLVGTGADPNTRLEDGSTPLHRASQFSETHGIVTALVEAGGDPHARATYGFTPLHLAAQSGTPGQPMTRQS